MNEYDVRLQAALDYAASDPAQLDVDDVIADIELALERRLESSRRARSARPARRPRNSTGQQASK